MGEHRVRIDLPDWQVPGTYSAELPCPGGPLFTASWTVLPPRPEPTLKVSTDAIAHADEITVDLDCKAYDPEERASVSFHGPGRLLEQVVEIGPTETGGFEYRTTFTPHFWWPPGRYRLSAWCPGPVPDDVFPGDPQPVDLTPKAEFVELVAPEVGRWDPWRPQVGPWFFPVPDGVEARHGQRWTVPPEGGSVTVAAECDSAIPRDGGARFVAFGFSYGDDGEDDWVATEFPVERLVEADADGVFVETTIDVGPGDPFLADVGDPELVILAVCTATPTPFVPEAVGYEQGSRDYPDPPEHVHVDVGNLVDPAD